MAMWDPKKQEMRKVSIRVPHATFWFRNGLEGWVNRLDPDLRPFPGRARGLNTPKEDRAALDVLSPPYDRTREFAGFLASDLAAIFPENLGPV